MIEVTELGIVIATGGLLFGIDPDEFEALDSLLAQNMTGSGEYFCEFDDCTIYLSQEKGIIESSEGSRVINVPFFRQNILRKQLETLLEKRDE